MRHPRRYRTSRACDGTPDGWFSGRRRPTHSGVGTTRYPPRPLRCQRTFVVRGSAVPRRRCRGCSARGAASRLMLASARSRDRPAPSPFFPPVSFTRLAPFIRSTSAILFRQNRIRCILAAAAAAALLVSPYRSDHALAGVLAGITVYVAFVGASTLWLVRHQRASIPLMSVHGVADV